MAESPLLQIAETDYIVLRKLSRYGYYIHKELSKILKIPKSKLTRSLSRLKGLKLVKERKKGRYKDRKGEPPESLLFLFI